MSNYFKFDDHVKIHYTIQGEGEQVVVFLHGFGATNHSWDDIKEKFPIEKYTLYLIDLKGHGLSSKPKDNKYSINDNVKIILSFIYKMKFENIILVGHSYGGGVALLTTLELEDSNQSELIDKLILIDCAAYLDEIPFFIDILKNSIMGGIITPILSSKFRAKYTMKRVFFNKEKVSDKIINRYAYGFDKKNNLYALRKMAKQIIPKNYNELIKRYSDIETSTLIVWGKEDPVISIKNGKRLHKELSNSSLKIVESCGHVPHEECPSETFRLIEDYIEKGK